LDTLTGWIFTTVVRLLALLPLSASRKVTDLLASLVWLSNPRAASTTRTNLELCFPALDASQREALGRRSLQQTARLLAEAGMLFHWPRERWSALLAVTGEELIEQARATGRGVLILAPHFGNWECLTLYLGKFAVTALYDPPRVASLEKPLRDARQRSGMRLLPIDRSGLRGIYEALHRGGVAGLLPDQVPARNAGIYAPFFGQQALTMTLAHRLIQSTRPIVLLGVARRVSGGFSIEFSPLPEGIYADDPGVSAATMNAALEALVRSDPSQYQWEYKRFRRGPRGQPDRYRNGRVN